MAKEDLLEFEGIVDEILPNAMFKVILENKHEVDWLLNYKGGSFVFKNNQMIENECIIRGVSYYKVSSSDINNIYQIIKYIFRGWARQDNIK